VINADLPKDFQGVRVKIKSSDKRYDRKIGKIVSQRGGDFKVEFEDGKTALFADYELEEIKLQESMNFLQELLSLNESNDAAFIKSAVDKILELPGAVGLATTHHDFMTGNKRVSMPLYIVVDDVLYRYSGFKEGKNIYTSRHGKKEFTRDEAEKARAVKIKNLQQDRKLYNYVMNESVRPASEDCKDADGKTLAKDDEVVWADPKTAAEKTEKFTVVETRGDKVLVVDLGSKMTLKPQASYLAKDLRKKGK